MRTIKRLGAGVLLVSTLVVTAACATIPEPDEMILYYTGGSQEGSKFQECIEPNTRGPGSVNNHTYRLPISLRTWNIRPEGGDTNKPIVAGSKPGKDGLAGPQVHVWATTEFYLNTYCGPVKEGKATDKNSPVVQFWEKTGRRYGVSDDAAFNEDGWRNALLNTLVPVIEKSMQTASRNYTADEMDSNLAITEPSGANEKGTATWAAMETDISAGFTEALRAKLGGDYFCGPTFNRASADCPPVRVSITDVNYADPSLQAARIAVRKAEEDGKKRLAEARAQAAEAEILSRIARDPNYMRIKELEAFVEAAKVCSANPTCTLVVTPPGQGVNVTTK